MLQRRRPRGLLALASPCVFGCTYPTELPITYETEHLRIGVEPEVGPLCAGDLDALERQIARTEDELGYPLYENYTVYLWSDESWADGAASKCDYEERVLGCVIYRSATIRTTRRVLEHELAHAAVGPSKLHPFFNEGMADVYAGLPTQFGNTAPSANSSSDVLTREPRTSAHFVRWLREREGPDRLADLVRSGGDGFENFEAVFGMSIEAAEQLYFSEAPFAYPSFDECGHPELDTADFVDGWIDTVFFDCEEAPDTRSAGEGMIAWRTFTIPESGYYSVSTDGDWFDIYRCGGRSDSAATDEPWLEDVPPSHAGYPNPAYRQYAGGEVHHLYFEAGGHDIGVGILGHEVGVAHVAIWPAIAATPGAE